MGGGGEGGWAAVTPVVDKHFLVGLAHVVEKWCIKFNANSFVFKK